MFVVGALAVAFAGLAVTVYALGAQTDGIMPAAAATREYTVRAENGKITVFPENTGLPEIETEIDTSGLREYDRQLLEHGIEVEGYRNMISLLEDFSN